MKYDIAQSVPFLPVVCALKFAENYYVPVAMIIGAIALSYSPVVRKQGEWWYNRELQISVQDNRMIYVDEHGYLCITELYTEKIVKRERAGKYIYDILYIPAKGVFILADDGVYEVIGI